MRHLGFDPLGCSGLFVLDVGVHAPGATKAEGSGLYAVHLLTPETADLDAL